MHTSLARILVLISAGMAGCATTADFGSAGLFFKAPRAADQAPAGLPPAAAVSPAPPAALPSLEMQQRGAGVMDPTAAARAQQAALLDSLKAAQADLHMRTRGSRPAVPPGSGTVQARVDERTSGTPSNLDRLTLSLRRSPGGLAPGAKDGASADSAARAAELARNIAELRRLQPGDAAAKQAAAAAAAATATAAAAAAAARAAAGVAAAAASAMPAASAATALQPGMVAWNTPPTMAMGETAEVELRVTLDERLFPGIAGRVQAGGSTTAEAAELSRDLTAKLESTAFDVKPDGERRQMVREGRDAVWRWVISPKLKGRQKLLLSITAQLANGPSIEPLVRSIDVTASANAAPDAIADFLQKNWEKLLTVILIPVAAWGWRSYQKRQAAAQA